jgi:hypothetical protein
MDEENCITRSVEYLLFNKTKMQDIRTDNLKVVYTVHFFIHQQNALFE